MMSKKVFLFSLFVFIFPTILVLAHGSGVSYEENKEGYKIDIGHDEFIAENESVRFDFALYPENIDNIEGEIFSDVWVTFTKENKIFFAGGIDKPVFGVTGFTYVFPEEGTYTVSARFQKEGETVVKTEFPILVIPPLEEKEETAPFVLYGVLFFTGTFIGGLFIFFSRTLFPKK